MAADLTPNALRVLEARYLRRDRAGRGVETPAQLFERVARAVAEAELIHGTAVQARRWESRFHEMLSTLDFLPNSPALMNAGTPLGQLSACFVLPVEDTMESIFGTLRDMALVQRTGGGTGFSISQLRPAGDPVVSTGDPGLLFLGAITRGNLISAIGQIESTNPCGEVLLAPYESCILGSINLAHLVVERDGAGWMDWERLRGLVHDGLHFLDEVITVNRYPLVPTAAVTQANNRKVGLGVMGFVEMLSLLGISYASVEAVRFAERLMAFIAREARAASLSLAEERGAFPNWERSIFAGHGPCVRNATQTSIAPTGTISIIAGTSSSIEPLFALAYRRRNVLGGEMLTEINPLLVRYLQRHVHHGETLFDAIVRVGRLEDVPQAPAELRRLFVTALDVPAEQHIRNQAAFQRHVDNAVSKTVNLPAEATPADIAGAYRLAYQLGCKGVTVFRYGSKPEQVLELGVDETPAEREHFTRCDPSACRL